VIIPAFQAAETIAWPVTSALEQTERAHEIIVCDDGSSDALLDTLAPFLDRLILLRQPHRGAGAARNHAVSAASGDYVVLLDADDVFLPGRLEALGDALVQRPDLDVVTTDAYTALDGRIFGRVYRRPAEFPVDRQRVAILRRNFVFVHAAIRRKRLIQVPFSEDRRLWEDWHCWMRLILSGSVVGLVFEPLSLYSFRSKGSVSSDRLWFWRRYLRSLQDVDHTYELQPEESEALRRSIREAGAQVAMAEADAAVREKTADARRRARRLLVTPDLAPSTRLKGLATWLAPGMARSYLRRRDARGLVWGPGMVDVQLREQGLRR
jgi:glycosyltransferase involved in cell wall biosynthesis